MTDVVVTTVEAFVAGVLARLTAKIPAFAIEAYPDKPDTYKLTHQKGAFLVAYRGADYGETVDTDAIAQVRTVSIDVFTLCRALNGAGASYSMLDMARVALVGWKVPGFTRIAATRDRFVGRDENVWTYAFTCSATTLAVELDDDTLDVLLAHLTLVSPFDTSEIPNA